MTSSHFAGNYDLLLDYGNTIHDIVINSIE